MVPRNTGVPEWASASGNERRLIARLQAEFAGFLDHFDAQTGRPIADFTRPGFYDNDFFVVLSDDCASMEDGLSGAVDCNTASSGVAEPASEMVT